MAIPRLTESEFKWARDHYAIRESQLPKDFWWASRVKAPRQINDSDCIRPIARLGMRVQGIRPPDGKIFRKTLNTGATGMDMPCVTESFIKLGIACEEYYGMSIHTVIDELARSKDLWVISHLMLAGTYGQHMRNESGHYAVACYVDAQDHIITTDPGIKEPGWGKAHADIWSKIMMDTLIGKPDEIVEGWVMRVGVKKNW